MADLYSIIQKEKEMSQEKADLRVDWLPQVSDFASSNEYLEKLIEIARSFRKGNAPNEALRVLEVAELYCTKAALSKEAS